MVGSSCAEDITGQTSIRFLLELMALRALPIESQRCTTTKVVTSSGDLPIRSSKNPGSCAKTCDIVLTKPRNSCKSTLWCLVMTNISARLGVSLGKWEFNMSNFRKKLEKVSAPYLVKLHSLPRWVLPIVLTVVLLIGLLANPNQRAGFWIGFIALSFIGIFLLWLLALSWPVLTRSSRFIRLLVALLIFFAAFSRF